MPFDRVEPRPSRRDPVVRAYVDPELGREGFTYVLASGREGSVHIDSVLEHCQDPATLAEIMVHELSVEAARRLERSRIPVRELARRLGSSSEEIHRLVETTSRRKSVQRLLELLSTLGCDVRFNVTDRRSRRSA